MVGQSSVAVRSGIMATMSGAAPMRGPLGRMLLARRDTVIEVCLRHGGHTPQIFGSVARGDDGPDSDIDLLVQLDAGRTLLDLERMQVELFEMLGVPVEVGTKDMLHAGIATAARADLVPL